jgi:hypothetical protein
LFGVWKGWHAWMWDEMGKHRSGEIARTGVLVAVWDLDISSLLHFFIYPPDGLAWRMQGVGR